MQNARILIVEDAADLREELVDHLQFHGHQVRSADSIATMTRALQPQDTDILLLDLGLPDGDAQATIDWLRQQFGLRLGIIIVTARGNVEDRVAALSSGADAYLVKPVNLQELRATITQLSQRLPGQGSAATGTAWQLNPIDLLLQTPCGRSVSLTGAETQLVATLLEADGEIISREELCSRIYVNQQVPSTRRLDTLVSRLRNKVRRATGRVPPIQSYRNLGYVFRLSQGQS